jgi:hypothetical protein
MPCLPSGCSPLASGEPVRPGPAATSRHAIDPRHSSQKYLKRFSAKSMYAAVLVGDPVRLSTPDLAILVCF